MEELVVERAGGAGKRRDRLLRSALDHAKAGDAALALPVAVCNDEIVAVAGRDGLEADLLRGVQRIHDADAAKRTGRQLDSPVLVFDDGRGQRVRVGHPVRHT